MSASVAANVLGTIGAVCWSIQLIPQIWLNYRRHNATGLQPSMMMLWAWAGIPLGVYNIVSHFNVALIVQPQILTTLSLVTWSQCYYYEHNWSFLRCALTTTPIAAVMAGIQVALIFALRVSLARGIEWPRTLMAVLAAVFLAAGVLRHYIDIARHRTVRGISFAFVALDALGDLTSLLAVMFQSPPDILGAVVYGVELALWLGIFACGAYYNVWPRLLELRRRRQSRHVQRQQQQRSLADADRGVTLHDLPSSTSVFRTVEADAHQIRARVNLAVLE